MTTLKSPGIPEERIRATAYSLWLEEGRPDGRAEDHWFKANALVAAEFTPAQKPRNGMTAPKKAARRKPS